MSSPPTPAAAAEQNCLAASVAIVYDPSSLAALINYALSLAMVFIKLVGRGIGSPRNFNEIHSSGDDINGQEAK